MGKLVIHYVILFRESSILHGAWYTTHLYHKAPQDEISVLPEPVYNDYSLTSLSEFLRGLGFQENPFVGGDDALLSVWTLEETFLHPIGRITGLFYDTSGKFRKVRTLSMKETQCPSK